MTPLHLSILLHYYYSPVDYPLIGENETRRDYCYDLVNEGYLFTPSALVCETIFKITKHGKKTIEKMLRILGGENVRE